MVICQNSRQRVLSKKKKTLSTLVSDRSRTSRFGAQNVTIGGKRAKQILKSDAIRRVQLVQDDASQLIGNIVQYWLVEDHSFERFEVSCTQSSNCSVNA